MSDLTQLLQLPRHIYVIASIWVVVMVGVPVVRWIVGEGAERIGVEIGVAAQITLVSVALIGHFGWWAAVVVAGVPLLGWLSELMGTRTGVPFGAYSYTEVLQPQLGRVPVLIPLAWLTMMPPSWAIGAIIAPNSSWLQWVLAAAAFTAWDLFLNPQMVSWGFWKWAKRGAYMGIPAANFLGRFLVSAAITALFGLVSIALSVRFTSDGPLALFVGIYTVTWVIHTISQLVIWKMLVSAAVGFLAMGVFVVLAFGRILVLF